MSLSVMRNATMILAVALIAGCSSGSSKGRGLLGTLGFGAVPPDEFLVLPQKPLELPEDLAALPQPTPGAVNRSDLTPRPDALAALGGRADAGINVASDGALLAATRANTATAGIRATLAAEDEVWRDTHRGRLLERLFNREGEKLVYGEMRLDPYDELARLRRLGIWTPAAPPQAAE